MRDRIAFFADRIRALQQERTPIRQGSELLVEMLPRDKQRKGALSKQSHSAVEVDTARVIANTSPHEIGASERPVPEMAAGEYSLYELPMSDNSPRLKAQRRNGAGGLV